MTVNDADSAAVDASDLSTLGGKTAGTVTVTNAVAISGSTAQATAALVTADTLVVVEDATVTLNDNPSIDATDLSPLVIRPLVLSQQRLMRLTQPLRQLQLNHGRHLMLLKMP